MAEHSTVNRRVAGSSPAWGVFYWGILYRLVVFIELVRLGFWVLMGHLKKYFSAAFINNHLK